MRVEGLRVEGLRVQGLSRLFLKHRVYRLLEPSGAVPESRVYRMFELQFFVLQVVQKTGSRGLNYSRFESVSASEGSWAHFEHF